MSVTSQFSDQPHSFFKKSFHYRRNDSEELDVFEAADYFSGHNEANFNNYSTDSSNETPFLTHHHHHHQKFFKEDGRRRGGGGRMSLDLFPLPASRQSYSSEKQIITTVKEIKKQQQHQQPSSPGGRIASFLNSIFSQSGSKKKKKISTSSKNSTPTMIRNGDDHDQIPRRRRSSLSTLIFDSSKYSYSSHNISGFRTPPAPVAVVPARNSSSTYTAETPNKNYFRSSHLDHQKQSVSTKNMIGRSSNGFPVLKLAGEEEKKEMMMMMMMRKKNHHHHHHNHDHNVMVEDEYEDKGGEGAESDSSSDLFELKICELDHYGNSSSTALPVYETTTNKIHTIKTNKYNT